jgi:hypothetical protein
MVYRYRVDCWVYPKSGFELAEQNSFMFKFKKLVREFCSGNLPFQKAIDNFGNSFEGMVLQSFIIESDKLYEENEEEVLAEIKKKIPEAIVVSHTMLKLVKA